MSTPSVHDNAAFAAAGPLVSVLIPFLPVSYTHLRAHET